MTAVVAVVEGPTEQRFVHGPLAAFLGGRGITIWAVLAGKAGKRGGVKRWESARGDIARHLKSGRYCTTMFDFYGLPSDWPGRSEAANLPWEQRGAHVEAALSEDLIQHLGVNFNPNQFVPYIQVHEFEALAFADVSKLAEVVAPLLPNFVNPSARFSAILETAGSPEAINDGYDACPSRRIMAIVKSYRKALHSPLDIERIGIEKLRSSCGHFGSWMTRLEALSVEGVPDAEE